MARYRKHAGVWKEATRYRKHAGVWKLVKERYRKVGGIWQLVYPSGSDPFQLSGSWEVDFEDWVPDADVSRTTAFARTGNYSIAPDQSGSGLRDVIFTLPPQKGLEITASVWTRSGSPIVQTRADISITENGGATNSATVTNTSTSWGLLSTSIPTTGSGEIAVTLKLQKGTARRFADDWTIEGVLA